MRAGRLDEPITIEQNTPGQDSAGGVTESWSTYTSTRAEVIEMTASERFRSSQRYNSTVARFNIRYTPGITMKMRIVYNTKYWRILGIREMKRRREMEITAEVLD